MAIIPEPDLSQLKKMHFIGVGGCSMSGLAQILHERGYEVTGSDLRESAFTEQLRRRNIPVFIGHDKKYVRGADLVVYSAAIRANNPEYAYASSHNIPMLERSKLLGILSGEYSTVAAIAGCHGKTTITSMLAKIMLASDDDCTVHVGGMVDFLSGGVKIGTSGSFITEACEYVRSFLTLHPTHILINNIDDDHLDCYEDIDDIFNTFVEFIRKQPSTGLLMLNRSDELAMRLERHARCRVVTFNGRSDSDWQLTSVTFDSLGCGKGDVMYRGRKLTTLKLGVPGMHNIKNALAATAFAYEVFGVDVHTSVRALEGYTLAGRRFELVGTVDGVKIIHDYAHHPSEIAACLAAARLVPHKKLWAVFQCNSFTRARTLRDKYALCFEDADTVIVPDIYPGRDTDTQDIHALDIVSAINGHSSNCMYLPAFEDIKEYLKRHWEPGDIVVTLGSGSVNKEQMVLLSD